MSVGSCSQDAGDDGAAEEEEAKEEEEEEEEEDKEEDEEEGCKNRQTDLANTFFLFQVHQKDNIVVLLRGKTSLCSGFMLDTGPKSMKNSYFVQIKCYRYHKDVYPLQAQPLN